MIFATLTFGPVLLEAVFDILVSSILGFFKL